MIDETSLDGLPGAELIQQGIDDLAVGEESIPALVVAIGAHRLSEKLPVVKTENLPRRPERLLYRMLLDENPREAYGRYNAYLRRLSRFCRALESRHPSE